MNHNALLVAAKEKKMIKLPAKRVGVKTSIIQRGYVEGAGYKIIGFGISAVITAAFSSWAFIIATGGF